MFWMPFDKKIYLNLFKKALAEERIKKSSENFKIKLFLQKAENSLLIAKHVKEIKPSKEQPKKNYWGITGRLLFLTILCFMLQKRLFCIEDMSLKTMRLFRLQ